MSKRAARAATLVLIWEAAAHLTGCGGCPSEGPAPTKVVDKAALIEPPARADGWTPSPNPNRDPPPPRTEPQLEADELAAALAEGRSELQAGRPAVAAARFRSCANRIPKSVVCEAELALAYAATSTHKAHVSYFLGEATADDDPEMTTDTYRRLAELAASRAQFPAATNALQIVVARNEADANDYEQLANALQADANRRPEAIDALTRAHQLAPSRVDLIHKRAVLLGQSNDHAGALAALEAYRDAASLSAAERHSIDEQIAGLRRTLGKASPPPDPTPSG